MGVLGQVGSMIYTISLSPLADCVGIVLSLGVVRIAG